MRRGRWGQSQRTASGGRSMTRGMTVRAAVLVALVIGACETSRTPLEVGVTRGEVVASSAVMLAPVARVGQLGASTALDGNTLVVGAPRAGDVSVTGGAAFVYERSTIDGNWALSA